MRKFTLLLLMTFIGFSAIAQNANEQKVPDNSEYMVTIKADVVSGAIEVTDPVYYRSFGDGYSIGCDWTNYGSRNVYYDVYPIYSPGGGALDISTINTGGATDCHFTLYCDPFNPADPTANVIAIDDDGGPGLMPAFVPADNYIVAANTQYYLVMTTYSSFATASYDINMGGDFVFGMVPPPTVPISNWAFALIGILALSLVLFKFRK